MFRKAVCIVMAVFSLSTGLVEASTIKTIEGNSVVDVTPPYIEAESAIIVDISTGQQLYGKNIYEKHYPASITKIMTCMLALENLNMDDVITFSEEAVNIEMNSTAAYVVEGEEVSVKDCVYGLMVHSCNDFANGLAEAVSGDLNSFAELMTERAKKLGCISTNFVNAHGLDNDEHYTCAYDMALFGMYAYDSQPLYKDIISTKKYQVEPTNKCEETRYWNNGHEMILEGYYYYDKCIGGKTGYDVKAKSTLVTYANINGRTLICVMLKAPSKGQAMVDTKALFEYIEKNVTIEYYAELDKLYPKEEETEDVVAGVDDDVNEEEQNTSKAASEENTEKKGMPIILKVLLWLFVIVLVGFILLYIYARYVVYVRRKKKREMRKKRQLEHRRKMEERYKQTRFYNDEESR